MRRSTPGAAASALAGGTAWVVAAAVLLVVVLGLGCGSAISRPAPPAPQRVVLISLDGASSFELWNLYRAGQFSAEGLGRFFAQGEVAQGLVEIDPPMTSPSHISIATGYAPDRTGIVGNWFHRPGQPILQSENGFASPIGTETLWEAARRQRLRVGVLGWPGADNTGPRRRADWGLSYTDAPQRAARMLVLGADDFSTPGAGAAAAARRVHLEPLRPRVRGDAAGATLEPADERLEITAVDRTDDGRLQYDALSIRALPPGAGAALVLQPGEWGRLWFPTLGKPGTEPPLASWVRVGRLDPDLRQVELYLGALYATPAYPAAFARRLAGAELAWPGPPDGRALEQADLGKPGLELNSWLEQSERFTAFFVDAMLAGVRAETWDLLLGYLPVIDEAGHEFMLEDSRQEGYSPARAAAFAAARARVWRAVDRQLERLLGALDLDSTTVMLVSDHGMAPVHSMVDADLALVRAGWQVLDPETGEQAPSSRATAEANGGLAHVYLNLAGREASGIIPPEQAAAAVEELRRMFLGMTANGERVFADAFSRAEARSLGLDHPHSGDLIVRTAPGYWLGSDRKHWRLPDGTLAEPVARSSAERGKHGFPSGEPRMYGIALALGAQVEPARPGLVPALGVAPRVAGWLGIEPPRASPP